MSGGFDVATAGREVDDERAHLDAVADPDVLEGVVGCGWTTSRSARSNIAR